MYFPVVQFVKDAVRVCSNTDFHLLTKRVRIKIKALSSTLLWLGVLFSNYILTTLLIYFLKLCILIPKSDHLKEHLS